MANLSFDILKSKERRKKVARQIKERSAPNAFFYSMMALSAIIVTLGLILNSVAMIIGAMLIAPFLYPLLALSLSATRGNIRLFKKALSVSLYAIIVIVFLSIIFSLIIPINEQSKDIFIYSSPNLIHLIAALAAGFVGALSVLWPKQSTAMAGALVAAALVPPLGVLGFALANGEPSLAWGSFLLFLTNFIAIVFAGTITLFLIGFRPAHKKESEKLFKENIIWSIVLLIIISLPLSWTLYRSVIKEKRENQLKNTVQELISPEVDLENVVFFEEKGKIIIKLTMFTPKLTDKEERIKIENKLESKFGKQIELEIKQIEMKKL